MYNVDKSEVIPIKQMEDPETYPLPSLRIWSHSYQDHLSCLLKMQASAPFTRPTDSYPPEVVSWNMHFFVPLLVVGKCMEV